MSHLQSDKGLTISALGINPLTAGAAYIRVFISY